MPAEKITQATVRVVGALHIDEVATVQGQFVPAASNPVSWQRYMGGVGSNAARAAQAVFDAKKSDHSVSIHAALGDDAMGRSLVASMRAVGVDIHPQLIIDHETGRYSVVVDESGQLIVGLADVQLGEQLQATPILPTLNASRTRTLLLDANLSAACIQALIDAASHTSIAVAALTVSPSKAIRLLPWARQITLLFCNRREALALAVESKLITAAKNIDELPLQQLADALVEMGFNDIVLTDAAAGLLIRNKGVFASVPVPPIKVEHNVNGAGDTLAGATIAALSLGLSLQQAVTQCGLTLAADVLAGRRLPLPV